jgi:hypothetical protein
MNRLEKVYALLVATLFVSFVVVFFAFASMHEGYHQQTYENYGCNATVVFFPDTLKQSSPPSLLGYTVPSCPLTMSQTTRESLKVAQTEVEQGFEVGSAVLAGAFVVGLVLITAVFSKKLDKLF